jgi:hypothetical protein
MCFNSWCLYRPDGSLTQNPFRIRLDLGRGVIAKVLISKNSDDSDVEIEIDMGQGEILELNVSPRGIVCSGF